MTKERGRKLEEGAFALSVQDALIIQHSGTEMGQSDYTKPFSLFLPRSRSRASCFLLVVSLLSTYSVFTVLVESHDTSKGSREKS